MTTERACLAGECSVRGVRFGRAGQHGQAAFSLSVPELAFRWGDGAGGSRRLPITGRSGSGKTTLLNLLAGLELPDDGWIAWRFVTEMGERAIEWGRAGPQPKDRVLLHRHLLGLAFQDSTLLPFLTVEENLGYPLRLCGIRRDLARESARSRLATFMTDSEVFMLLGTRASGSDAGPTPDERARAASLFAKRYPRELSGGQRQRVALLQSYIHDPAVVLADEPTGSLDMETRSQIMDVVFRWLEPQKGGVFLWVTHHEQDVQFATAEEWIVVEDGIARLRSAGEAAR